MSNNAITVGSTNMLKGFLQKLSAVTRAKDWRLSFVPFIMGCVYLWLWWFNISFSIFSAKMILLSLTTTVGFAILGYFVNEFFDKESDAKAGKLNKLAHISASTQFGIFLLGITLTFMPWVWLPTTSFSWCMIALQISLFLIYSLPQIRLKESPYLSLIIDSGYAYVVPTILSFHTFGLIAQVYEVPLWFYFLTVAVFFIGLRNIIVHQVNDIFKDYRIGHKTLPLILGVNKSNKVIFIIAAYEIFFLMLWSIVLLFDYKFMILWITPFTVISFITLMTIRNVNYQVSTDILLINRAYQYLFPLFSILILLRLNQSWIFLLFLHTTFLVPQYLLVKAKEFFKVNYYLFITFFAVKVRHVLSLSVNVPIYMLFKICGINLIKEKKSALEYIKSKFSYKKNM